MYLHTPVVEAGSWWRTDTASGSDTPTTVYAYDGTDPITNWFVLSGSTVRNTTRDGTAQFWSATQTLYLKELTYQGAPNGTVVTSVGVLPPSGPAGLLFPVLNGPNTWTGTQDFTGATVTGVTGSGGGAAALLDRGNWATGTAYAVGDVTTQAGRRYACRTAHTSGTFATDLAASKWVLLDAVAAAADSAVVHNTGDETVAGVKTFSSAPAVPSASFPESAVTGLTTDLAAKAPTARTLTAGTGLTGGGDLTADRTLTVAYGTTSGTAAQGNDSRITGAVQAANNLSDVTAASARSNLGLGTAATISATAGGDLSGTLPSPTVAKVNGVAVTGTPSAGYVPTATGSTAATWQAVSVAADKLGLTPTAVKTANYSAAAGDFVPVDTTSGAVTVTLPTAPADGTVVAVKHVVRGGTNTVSLALGGSDHFNTATGPTTGTVTLVNQGLIAQYKASLGVWYGVADDLPLAGLDTRYGALAGPNTWTGTQDFSGATFTGLWQYSLAAVGDYIETGNLTSTQNSLGEGQETATPFFISSAVTIDRIAMFLGATVATTGGLVRLAIRNFNATTPSAPGTLLVDGGTVDVTSGASTLKTVTVSQSLTPGIYWVSTTTQGGAGTRPGICTIANPIVRAPGTSFTNGKYNIGVFGPTGTTGALNSSFGTIAGRATDGQAPWLALRRSA